MLPFLNRFSQIPLKYVALWVLISALTTAGTNSLIAGITGGLVLTVTIWAFTHGESDDGS